MNEKEHKRVADVEEARTKLLECFPGSLIRDSDNVGYEFIAHPRTNQSFILEDKITQKLERLVRMMAKLWAQEIMFAETMEDAKALYERCPRLLKEKVKAILIKSGFEEITQ